MSLLLQVVVAPVMASVADVLESVRQVLSWLERKPFERSDEYHGVRTTLIRSPNCLLLTILTILLFQLELGACNERAEGHLCRDASGCDQVLLRQARHSRGQSDPG